MSIQPSQQIQIAFSIITCKCIFFELTEYAKQNKVQIPADKIGFNLGMKFDLDEKRKVAVVTVNSTVTDISNQSKEIAKLEALNEFLILNFDEAVTRNQQGLLLLPDQILMPMLSISVSNVRGMYAVKLEDTMYVNTPLALIDASQLIPKRPPTVLG